MRWRITSKAAWTSHLIPDAGRWAKKTLPRIPLTFYMKQARQVTAVFSTTSTARAEPLALHTVWTASVLTAQC